MHAAQRERLILDAIEASGFITYRDLEARLDASPATIRRDLTRLEKAGSIVRVHGGAKPATETKAARTGLAGTPFEQSITQRLAQKQAARHCAQFALRQSNCLGYQRVQRVCGEQHVRTEQNGPPDEQPGEGSLSW